MHLYIIIPASLFMIALGIALEVALSISQKNQGSSNSFLVQFPMTEAFVSSAVGFNVPEKNVFKFASQQFLTVSIRARTLVSYRPEGVGSAGL